MCARVRIMFGGAFRDIVIKAGGLPKAAFEIQNIDGERVIDVRHRFDRDLHPAPGAPEMPHLIALARLIRNELVAREKGRLVVQCEAGQSRSARTVGAFLMLFNNWSKTQAMEELTKAYANREPGCQQMMTRDLVLEWLNALEIWIDAKGLAGAQATPDPKA
ncbi:MAG: hypothetical protein AAF225_11185 [Pseudomonadota bacterium]